MKRVLVVDDEPDLDTLIRQKFRRQIRAGELELLSARNGVEALEVLARSGDVEVALCDINMPKMDGLTLLEQLRERFPLVKPVMISAYGDMENIRGAMNRGAFDFLTKPLDLRDLAVTVGRALEQARRVRETIQSIRENNILRMFVNDAVFDYLSQSRSVEQLRRAETIVATVVFFDVCGFTPLSERGVRGHLIEIADPAEESFPYSGRTEFRAPETGEHEREGNTPTENGEPRRDFRSDLPGHGVRDERSCVPGRP